MPAKKTTERARKDKQQGKSASTQAGEFVREEIHHVRQGKHGARSAKQAIAIGLSKARRAGVELPAPKKGQTSESTRKKAQRDVQRGQGKSKSGENGVSRKRSQAGQKALKREGQKAASHTALSRQAKQAARSRRQPAASR